MGAMPFKIIVMPRTKAFIEENILDKAIHLFCEKGYHATSASDLVAHLGLSRSSIYATFSDKHQLFTQCLERYCHHREVIMSNMVAKSEDIPKTLQEIFHIIINQEMNVTIPKGCLMVNTGIELAAHDDTIAQIVHTGNQRMIDIFEVAIRKGQKFGQISKERSPKTLAAFIFNNISGIRVALKSNTPKVNYQEIIKLCLSVLNDRRA